MIVERPDHHCGDDLVLFMPPSVYVEAFYQGNGIGLVGLIVDDIQNRTNNPLC